MVTPKNFSSNVCTRDYARDDNYCANFGDNRFSGGFSPSRWNITPLWSPVLSFFSMLRPVEPVDRFSRFMAQTTCFHARKCLLGVTTIDDIIWGKICPKTPKSGRERQFQTNMPKYENRSISKTVNPIKPKFEDKTETATFTSWVVCDVPRARALQ